MGIETQCYNKQLSTVSMSQLPACSVLSYDEMSLNVICNDQCSMSRPTKDTKCRFGC